MLAELVGKLKEKLDPKKRAARSAGEKHKRGELCPNLDRLTVGVDLGDQWSHWSLWRADAMQYSSHLLAAIKPLVPPRQLNLAVNVDSSNSPFPSL